MKTATIFEPKIELPVGAIAPDDYIETLGLIPPDHHVVSRNRDRTVASTYGDLVWNLSAYHPEEKPTVLNFSYWQNGAQTPIRDQLCREARWLIFVLMWKRKGTSLSSGTLRNYLTVIRYAAQYAEDFSCKIQDILSDENRFFDFVNTRCSGWSTETLGSLMPHLVKIGHEGLGFNIVSDKLLRNLRASGRKYRTTLKQHAPIPTRIYSSILSNLDRELTQWEAISTDFLQLLVACAKNPLLARSKGVQRSKANTLGLLLKYMPEFSEAASLNIKEYLSSNKNLMDVKGMSAAVVDIQLASKLSIQAFSGMRDDEAMSLPYNCLETTVSNGKKHYIILGRTTKLNGGKIKRTRWVSNEAGYRAIKIAQQIADAIYEVLEVNVKNLTTRKKDRPLFASVGYLGLAGGSPILKNDRFFSGSIYLYTQVNLRARLQPIIEHSDLLELEQIDLHRAWRAEDKYQIGKPWHFTSHQLRRTLALYAQRSGLVSLPSLRRQLQHLTEEMSAYYARGSAYAVDFIGDQKNHFGLEWQETQPESAFLGFVLKVVLSDVTLSGGHGNWLAQRREIDSVVLLTREDTLKRYKNGQMAWTETFVGGCTNIGVCNKPVMNFLDADCIRDGCRHQVILLPKLERAIAIQTAHVHSLNTSSLEYRSEKADLDVLVSERDKMMLKHNGAS